MPRIPSELPDQPNILIPVALDLAAMKTATGLTSIVKVTLVSSTADR
ncbi:MAG: hypothetical protein ACLPSF_05950 [Methylocella sp.]